MDSEVVKKLRKSKKYYQGKTKKLLFYDEIFDLPWTILC